MLTKIDKQLQAYDERVGSSLQMISCDPQGRIPVADLQKALAVIKHRPDEEIVDKITEKLDVDKDGYVELEHVLGLVREEGLGELLNLLMSPMADPFSSAKVLSSTMRPNPFWVKARSSKTVSLERRT